MRVACLHTVESNVAVFDAARPPSVELQHVVRSDLLQDAERDGGLTPAIHARAAEALLALAANADAVLLTCSTVGPAVESVKAAVPVLRVDAALAEAAAVSGGRVVVLCAAETTIGPTRALFERVSGGRIEALEMRLVPDAWAAFRAGDIARYHQLIAAAADAAFAEGARTVALAQASMAGAAKLAQNGRPLASPEVGLEAVARQKAAPQTAA